jgi:sugar lactone lactonase YvrE
MNKRITARRCTLYLTLFVCFLLSGNFVRAGQPLIWEVNSRTELLRGEARGVSITDTGEVMLAPRFTQVFNTEQSYIWSSAMDEAGNVYLGTGHDGRLFRVGRDGHGALIFKAPELDVTALAIARDGTLYVGTSPDGKVYRIAADGKSEVYFDPSDKYIWSLAALPDGSLAVGTGDSGKLYRVRAKGAKPEASVLIDTNETHVISLAVDAQGNLIAGTDPSGLILRISPEGKAFALFDAPLREIHALAPAPDGSIYALALSDAASTTAPRGTSPITPAPSPSSAPDASSTQSTVTVSITPVDDASGSAMQPASTQSARSRNDLQNARSAVFRILPDGSTDVLWSSTSITAFAVAAAPQGGVLIGTADKGRIYAVTNDGRDTLLLQSSEAQISSFVARGRELFAASSNGGKFFHFSSETNAEGIYESPVHDAKLVSSWGRIWWRGRGVVELQTRTGNSERPDATWSDWSTVYRDSAGAQISSPRARYIQWRAVLHSAPPATNNHASGAPPQQARMADVRIAYLQRNVAPEVVSITTLPVGVGLQAAMQAPVDPNIEASGLDPSLFGAAAQTPPRRIFQRGALSLMWQAEDRNNDNLEYAIYYRSLNESDFHLLKDKVRENFFTIDGATLADGRYIFKIVASDAPDNPQGQALTGERISEPVDIDNTPPNIHAIGQPQLNGNRARISFDVEDVGGIIKHADVSVDGGQWRAVFPDDGIADSPRERYTIEVSLDGAGEHAISLRAFDASGNVGSARVTVRR